MAIVIILTRSWLPNPPTPDSPEPSAPPVGTVHTEALDMVVSVINVGQGDSILIMSEGEALLVDAGTAESGAEVVAYLESCGITDIDYLVATHPDADHIGGMAAVLTEFDVEHDIIAPEKTSTTNTYKKFVQAVDLEPGVSLTTPAVGTTYVMGDATIEVIANGYGATDTNDASIILKVTCDGKSILLTGDASSKVEAALIADGADLDSDVLKVGHHGSRTSTSTEFLDAVTPDFAVISSGGKYGHPHQETLDRLAANNAKVYRTDTQGTVVFLFSDGTIEAKAA
jgi:competence protein ComEC